MEMWEPEWILRSSDWLGTARMSEPSKEDIDTYGNCPLSEINLLMGKC